MEKLERPLDSVFILADVPPQGLDESDEDPPALLQSMPLLWVVYEGVVVAGDTILPMPIPVPGLDCVGEKVGLPMPGLLGAMAGNDELSELSPLSGVTALFEL